MQMGAGREKLCPKPPEKFMAEEKLASWLISRTLGIPPNQNAALLSPTDFNEWNVVYSIFIRGFF